MDPIEDAASPVRELVLVLLLGYLLEEYMNLRRRYQYGCLTEGNVAGAKTPGSFAFMKLPKKGYAGGAHGRLVRLHSTPLEQMLFALSSHFGIDLT